MGTKMKKHYRIQKGAMSKTAPFTGIKLLFETFVQLFRFTDAFTFSKVPFIWDSLFMDLVTEKS